MLDVMGRGARITLIVGLTTLTLAGVWAALEIYPWIKPPPEEPEVIERRWAALDQLARASDRSGGPRELLDVIGSLELSALGELPITEGGLAYTDPVDRATLPTEMSAAVDQLTRWRQRGGGLGAERCPPLEPRPLSAIQLMWLARVALHVSRAADDPAALAALELGAQLRERGGLLDGVVGFSIADESLRWAQDRGYPPTALREHRPTRAQLVSLVAREIVCSYELAERELAREAEAQRGASRLQLPTGARGIQRELAMVRWYWGERLHGVAPDAPPQALLARLPDIDDYERLPESVLLRALAVPFRGQVESVVEKLARYDEFLDSP